MSLFRKLTSTSSLPLLHATPNSHSQQTHVVVLDFPVLDFSDTHVLRLGTALFIYFLTFESTFMYFYFIHKYLDYLSPL